MSTVGSTNRAREAQRRTKTARRFPIRANGASTNETNDVAERDALSFEPERDALSFVAERDALSFVAEHEALSFEAKREALSFVAEHEALSFVAERSPVVGPSGVPPRAPPGPPSALCTAGWHAGLESDDGMPARLYRARAESQARHVGANE